MNREDAHPLVGWQNVCRHSLKWCHWKSGLFDVEMSYSVCTSCDFNLLYTYRNWHVCGPTASILSDGVSAPIFVGLVTAVLIKGLSRAFHLSQIMILPKQDYPGVEEAFLQICHFTTLNKTAKSVFIRSRFATYSFDFFKVMTNYSLGLEKFTMQASLYGLQLCPEWVKVNSTKVSGWKYKNLFSYCF